MIKTTDHPDIKSGLPLEAVVGIYANNEKTAVEYGYRVTGHETEEVLNGSSKVIEAVADFFLETQTRSHDERQSSYNCHSFIAYCLGRQSTSRHANASGFKLLNTEVAPSQLVSTTPYALIDKNDEHVHSTLGIDRPEYSMGVLGTNNPMVICANGLLKYLYNAKQIREIDTTVS